MSHARYAHVHSAIRYILKNVVFNLIEMIKKNEIRREWGKDVGGEKKGVENFIAGIIKNRSYYN
jgi:predicted TPR repeat methyltransferase